MKRDTVVERDYRPSGNRSSWVLTRSLKTAISQVPLIRKQNRAVLTLLTALCLVLINCSFFSPSDSETYSLEHVDGHVLPATIISATTVNGDVYEFQVVHGTLMLKDFGRVRIAQDFRDVWNGVPSDTVKPARWSGSYERTDTSLTIQFTDAQSLLHVVTYRILEQGRVLRGVEGDFAPRTYEYIRK